MTSTGELVHFRLWTTWSRSTVGCGSSMAACAKTHAWLQLWKTKSMAHKCFGVAPWTGSILYATEIAPLFMENDLSVILFSLKPAYLEKTDDPTKCPSTASEDQPVLIQRVADTTPKPSCLPCSQSLVAVTTRWRFSAWNCFEVESSECVSLKI